MPVSEAPEGDAELLFNAVREAGALALSLQGQGLRHWQKSDGSPVTEADLAVDRLLRERLAAARPTYGWLSEETPDGAARLEAEALWIADPIDGTRSFAAGGDCWCVAVALIRAGRPCLAAIYRPATEEFFSAIAGQGARRNGSAIAVRDGAIAGARVIGTSNALSLFDGQPIAGQAPGALPLQLRLAAVASGVADGAVSLGRKNDWDLAAGDLLVQEAGGRAGSLAGETFVYNRHESWQQGLLAAGASRHRALIGVIAKT